MWRTNIIVFAFSYALCIPWRWQETATKLQNFVRNLNLDGYYEHDHGNSNFYHTHVIKQKYEPILKHICLKAKGN